MIHIALALSLLVVICSEPLDKYLVKRDRNAGFGARDRELRAREGLRRALTWLSREICARVHCVVRGHYLAYAAFEPVVVCARCRRVIHLEPFDPRRKDVKGICSDEYLRARANKSPKENGRG